MPKFNVEKRKRNKEWKTKPLSKFGYAAVHTLFHLFVPLVGRVGSIIGVWISVIILGSILKLLSFFGERGGSAIIIPLSLILRL